MASAETTQPSIATSHLEPSSAPAELQDSLAQDLTAILLCRNG